MPAKESYDPITNPKRQKAAKVAKVVTDAPAIWSSKPASSAGIPGVYGASGKQGPTGPAPQSKV